MHALFYQEGSKIASIQPSAYVVGNMVRRVLKIIREEYATLLGQSGESVGKDSLHRMLTAAEAGLSLIKFLLQVGHSCLIQC